MNQNKLQSNNGTLAFRKRRGVAEVISTLLLVVVTVVGAVLLTSFMDEAFVAGSQSVISGTDTATKTIKLRGYDTRNGDTLMSSTDYALNNTNIPAVDDVLCRNSCATNTTPDQGGSDFVIIQIENRGIDSIYLKNIYLDNVSHPWDPDTANKILDTTASDSFGGLYPTDGRFSVLSEDTSDPTQRNNEVRGGLTVNVLVKLDTVNSDLELNKTVRVEVNLGENKLSDFLIETGDAR